MRELRRLAWAAVVAAGATTPGLAQQGGGGGGGGSFPGSATVTPARSVTTSGGNPIGGSFGSQGGNSGGGGGSGSGGSASPTTQGAALQQFQQSPPLSPPSLTQNGSSNSALSPSNFLANFYNSPYYQGRGGQGTTRSDPGYFGQPVYGTTGGAGGRVGAGGGAGGQFGGGQFGTGRAGTVGGLSNTDPGVVVQVPRAIAYTAQVRFPVAAAAPARLQADLRGAIDGTPLSMLTNPAAVQVVVADGNNVVLRGAVRDEDEARLVEGLARLTPGVRGITNELTYPRP